MAEGVPDEGLRSWAAHTLAVLGLVAVASGAALGQIRRGVFESDAFADRLAQSLNDPRVSAFVLLRRARQCEQERRKLPNILAVDFYRTGDLMRVVRTLNGLDAGPPPAPSPALASPSEAPTPAAPGSPPV